MVFFLIILFIYIISKIEEGKVIKRKQKFISRVMNILWYVRLFGLKKERFNLGSSVVISPSHKGEMLSVPFKVNDNKIDRFSFS